MAVLAGGSFAVGGKPGNKSYVKINHGDTESTDFHGEKFYEISISQSYQINSVLSVLRAAVVQKKIKYPI